MFHKLKAVFPLLSISTISFLVSSGALAKPVGATLPSGGTDAVTSADFVKEIKDEAVLQTAFSDFLSNCRAQVKKDSSGNEITLIGNVEFTDIKPSASLGKDNDAIEAYLKDAG